LKNLADVVLGYYWFLNFCSDDVLDPDAAVEKMEHLADTVENEFTDSERAALREAATRSMALWLREPDEHGHTPRKLLTSEKRAFLQAIIDGHFSGPPVPAVDV
jgi:hypothetical protein